MGKKTKSSKRKNREAEVDGEVLLPKSKGDEEGLDFVDDPSEPTLGDKLAILKLEGKDVDPIDPNHEIVDSSLPAKPPSADSVNVLVKQALHADDRTLLIDCLFAYSDKMRRHESRFHSEVVIDDRFSQMEQELEEARQERQRLAEHAKKQEEHIKKLEEKIDLIITQSSRNDSDLPPPP